MKKNNKEQSEKERKRKAIRLLAENFDRKLSSGLVDFYIKELTEHSAEIVEKACRLFMIQPENNGMPIPGQLLFAIQYGKIPASKKMMQVIIDYILLAIFDFFIRSFIRTF